MATLTIDLGWSFGWCTWRRGDAIASGHVNLGRLSDYDGGRLLEMSRWLTGKRDEINRAGETLTDVVYEEINFIGDQNGVDALHAHGKQLGNLERWCAFYKIRCRGIAWNTIKKHVTGHGSASRQTMLEVVQKRFPEVTNADQSSAVAVMLTAKDKFAA